ncbi:MAG TPA: YIP1 family protein [Bryobacteraceae bacterium]|nr:YIP1 family protein [Bryobacteraceae bacterium]
MSTLVPDLPLEPRESFGDDLVGMGSFFIDPEGAARRAFHKWFWIGPLIVVSIVAIITQLVRLPITQQVMETMSPPNGISDAQWARQTQISLMIQHIAVWCSPIIVVVLYAFQAVVLLAMCSILTVNAKYRTLFNIVAGCSLISMLEAIASVLVLRMKAPVSTLAELKPPLGLDIFLSEGANKFLMGFLGYFTIFNLWWIVMIVLVLAAAFRISKGKAFALVLPLILIGLVFVVIGAVFTGSRS